MKYKLLEACSFNSNPANPRRFVPRGDSYVSGHPWSEFGGWLLPGKQKNIASVLMKNGVQDVAMLGLWKGDPI